MKPTVFITRPIPTEVEAYIAEHCTYRIWEGGGLISRSKTVDESALIEALAQKKIWAAGLDVFDEEPVSPDNPLLRMANVVTLPHIGSATHKTLFEMAMLAAENLVAALSGKTPPNVVNELKEVKK
jgi:gluconate 2-dehydrogenase